MKKITVSASFGGKIPTGSYQNMNPSFYAQVEQEVDEIVTEEQVSNIIRDAQQKLQSICYSNFEAEVIKAKILKIQNDRKDFRWYKLPSGDEVPSVTSIIGFDTDYLIDSEELKQYASQGNIIHAQVATYIKEGVWKEPKDIMDITSDIFILKTGSLKLPLEGWSFESFIKKYPVKDMKNGHSVINEKDMYGGEYDFEGKYEEEYTICDVKRTPDKIKNFMQMAAYAKCLPHIKKMMIVPLNDKTKQGFSEPIISTDIDKYYELFLYKRKEFKKVYGI